MIEQFIKYTQELFPSISPYTADNTLYVIKKYKSRGGVINFLETSPFNYLAQGDIIDSLRFYFINDTGELGEMEKKGMLLSNTCDADHDPCILFSPCYELPDLVKMGFNEADIKSNRINNFFYIDGSTLVVDFSCIMSYSTELINNLLKDKIISKYASLNRFGYYFYLCKLTIHFMKPEDTTTNSLRNSVMTS